LCPFELEKQWAIDAERTKIRAAALKDADEHSRFKIAEKDKTITNLQTKLQDALRKGTTPGSSPWPQRTSWHCHCMQRRPSPNMSAVNNKGERGPERAFADNKPAPVGDDHPLRKAGDTGMSDISQLRLNLYGRSVLGLRSGLIYDLAFGQGHVIFTRIDLITGLLGTCQRGNVGFEPETAQTFFKNLVLWSARRVPAPLPVPAEKP